MLIKRNTIITKEEMEDNLKEVNAKIKKAYEGGFKEIFADIFRRVFPINGNIN